MTEPGNPDKMKLKIFIAMLILSTAHSFPLRSQPLDSLDLERLANYVNCELTEAYLENYVKKIKGIENLEAIVRTLSTNSIDQPITYDSLKKLLSVSEFSSYGVVGLLGKLNNNKSKALVFTGPDSELINILLNDTSFQDETKEALQKTKVSLQKELTVEIEKIRKKTAPLSLSGEIDSGTESPEEFSIHPGDPKPNLQKFFPFINFLIALGALTLAFMAYKKVRSRTRNDETIDYERQKFRYSVDQRFDALDRKTRTLESDFIELREKQRTIVQSPRMDPVVVVPGHPKTEPVHISSPWLYLSSFNEDGSFERSSLKSEYSPSTAKYKVKIDSVDKAMAEFEFCGEGAALRDSLSNPDKYLKPLCRINSPADYNSVKRIVTEKSGKAELRGDRWIVEFENKAVITLL